MSKLARTLASLCLAALLQSAHATPASTNFSDLWYNPAEPGWGINIDQQGDLIFATLFVYGQDNSSTWFFGVLNLQSTAPDGTSTFSGDWLQSRGPWFGGNFNAAAVTARKVGTATFRGTTTGATLSYTVDSTSVSKQVQRQTLRANSMIGSYLGATNDVTFACNQSARNGLVTSDVGPISIIQVADVVTIFAPTCTYVGTFVQQGQTGTLQNGAYTCRNGAQGAISFSDVYVEQSGIIGKYIGRDSACSFTGTIGAARR